MTNDTWANRRRADRPSEGDRRPCLSCGRLMRFQERHAVMQRRQSVPQPAWRCRCGDDCFVRLQISAVTNIAAPAEDVRLRLFRPQSRSHAMPQRVI